MPRFFAQMTLLLSLSLLMIPALQAQETSPILVRGTVIKRPITVMVDNHINAVPQSGFNQAAIVFEALAEGGITRFMMLFNADMALPSTIGPVRSTRLYYGQLAQSFEAVHVHAGGSPAGLNLMATSTMVYDVDGLKRAHAAPFYRSKANVAPHNLYTSGDGIAVHVANHTATYTQPAVTNADGTLSQPVDGDIGYLYRGDADATQRPAGMQISYYFLSKATGAAWGYDPGCNCYLRSVRGKVAIDANDKQQITTKNIIVLEVPSQRIMGDPKGRMDVSVIGNGRAVLFQDGLVFDIEWRKETAEAPLRFYYLDGVSEVSMVHGAVWMAIIPTLTRLSMR